MMMTTKRRRSRFNPKRAGASAVEMSLVAGPLFLIVLGSIEFARGAMVAQGLEKAAREGCRVGVLEGATKSEVEAKVAQILQINGIRRHSVSVVPDPPSGAKLWGPITVRVSARYGDSSWLPVPRFLADKTLSAACTLPREGGQE